MKTMASVIKLLKCGNTKLATVNLIVSRSICTSAVVQANASESWFSKLLMVRKIEPGHDSHSRLLSSTDVVYEMQIHDVKPQNVDDYLKNYETYINVAQGKSDGTELVASFHVEIGSQDQYLHLWRFKHGYPHASDFLDLCHNDSDLKSLINDRIKLLRRRENQFMLPFSFWGHPEPRNENKMYEMRSYVLKPGTMIEWGNNWARGVSYRKESAVAGFFSQIGQLYTVHHLWGYKDLQSRKDIRDAAWRKPGWDECVAHTVPLIREMQSRWLKPLPFSPIK